MEQSRQIYSKLRKSSFKEGILKLQDPILRIHTFASILKVLKILQGHVLI